MMLKNNRATKYLHQVTNLQFLKPTPLLAHTLRLS